LAAGVAEEAEEAEEAAVAEEPVAVHGRPFPASQHSRYIPIRAFPKPETSIPVVWT